MFFSIFINSQGTQLLLFFTRGVFRRLVQFDGDWSKNLDMIEYNWTAELSFTTFLKQNDDLRSEAGTVRCILIWGTWTSCLASIASGPLFPLCPQAFMSLHEEETRSDCLCFTGFSCCFRAFVSAESRTTSYFSWPRNWFWFSQQLLLRKQ